MISIVAASEQERALMIIGASRVVIAVGKDSVIRAP